MSFGIRFSSTSQTAPTSTSGNPMKLRMFDAPMPPQPMRPITILSFAWTAFDLAAGASIPISKGDAAPANATAPAFSNNSRLVIPSCLAIGIPAGTLPLRLNLLDDRVTQTPDPLDFHFHEIPGLEPDRRRSGHADPVRRSGQNHV